MSTASWLKRPRTILLMPFVVTVWAAVAQDYAMAAVFAVATLVAVIFSILGAAVHASKVIAGADQLIEDHRRGQRRRESAQLRATPTSV